MLLHIYIYIYIHIIYIYIYVIPAHCRRLAARRGARAVATAPLLAPAEAC